MNSKKRQHEINYPLVFYLKARAIRSGETPQKSLILPPVHTFVKGLVAPLNLMFSYFLRIFGGVKFVIFLVFDEICKKSTKNYKNCKKITKNIKSLQKIIKNYKKL